MTAKCDKNIVRLLHWWCSNHFRVFHVLFLLQCMGHTHRLDNNIPLHKFPYEPEHFIILNTSWQFFLISALLRAACGRHHWHRDRRMMKTIVTNTSYQCPPHSAQSSTSHHYVACIFFIGCMTNNLSSFANFWNQLEVILQTESKLWLGNKQIKLGHKYKGTNIS